MAVDWSDFRQAGITEARHFDALKDALAERCAAACAGAGESIDFPAGEQWRGPVPDLYRLTRLRSAICSLAPRFVRIEDELYRWQAWSRFPIAYTRADPMKGDHSLAILPSPGTPEANADLLGVYRDFLENCAWWLGRFRYVDVSGASFFTRRSTAWGGIDISDEEYWGHEESGAEPETFMASPEHEPTGPSPGPAGTMIECSHRDSDRYEDTFRRDGGWQYDTDRYQHRSVSATAYSGLVVRNFSGLRGRLLLVPCLPYSSEGRYPTRQVETDEVESLIDVWPADPDGDFYAGEVVFTRTTEELHGQDWLETFRYRGVGTQTWRREGERDWDLDQIVRSEWRDTRWSPDGSRSYSETETGEDTSWYYYSVSEDSETRIRNFDGFGEWTLGVPVDRGAVPGHGRVTAIPERDSIPLPDIWDLSPFRKWRRDLHPRDRYDDVSYDALLRVVPVIDFNDSYQHQGN